MLAQKRDICIRKSVRNKNGVLKSLQYNLIKWFKRWDIIGGGGFNTLADYKTEFLYIKLLSPVFY